MEYTYVEPSWEQERDKGNMKQAIECIRIQIATNLMLVHNHFSDAPLSSPEEIYGYYRFDNVRRDAEMDFMIYRSYANQMREIKYRCELNVPDNSTLNEYLELENHVKEKMRSI